jgi:hypothetical protein
MQRFWMVGKPEVMAQSALLEITSGLLVIRPELLANVTGTYSFPEPDFGGVRRIHFD